MKQLITRMIIAFTGCIVMYIIHDGGSILYHAFFLPQSHGIGLGFVKHYILFISFPLLITTSFLSKKHSFILSLMALFYLCYSWFALNPLRVTLIFLAYSISYISILFLSKRYHIT